jgi:hypothetical protein
MNNIANGGEIVSYLPNIATSGVKGERRLQIPFLFSSVQKKVPKSLTF